MILRWSGILARGSKVGAGAGKEVVCGFHAVRGLLANAGEVVEVLFAENRRDGRQRDLQGEFRRVGVACRSVAGEELAKYAGGVRHQGVVARVRGGKGGGQGQGDLAGFLDARVGGDSRGASPLLLLILDQVQDPHNLGACLRSAAAAGVDAVILPKEGACPITASVTRVAAGAASRVPVFYVANLARAMRDLQQRGIWITGGDSDAAQTLYEVDFTAPAAIAMGAEGGGLRRLTREGCDHLARIPMLGEVASLNVSVASAIFLFEVLRQRELGKAGAGLLK